MKYSENFVFGFSLVACLFVIFVQIVLYHRLDKRLSKVEEHQEQQKIIDKLISQEDLYESANLSGLYRK